jgi:hypothetical protein
MIKKHNTNVFSINQKLESDIRETGEFQPPRKQITNNTESHNIFEYSARKNIAKVIDEYSML